MNNTNLKITTIVNVEAEKKVPTSIKYTFVDGTSVEIEVGEAWAKVVLDMRREEDSANRLARMRCVTLDVLGSEGAWTRDLDSDPYEILESIKWLEEFVDSLNSLNDEQRELVEKVFEEGMSKAEFAELKGISRAAVTDRLNRIRKKFKKLV